MEISVIVSKIKNREKNLKKEPKMSKGLEVGRQWSLWTKSLQMNGWGRSQIAGD